MTVPRRRDSRHPCFWGGLIIQKPPISYTCSNVPGKVVRGWKSTFGFLWTCVHLIGAQRCRKDSRFPMRLFEKNNLEFCLSQLWNSAEKVMLHHYFITIHIEIKLLQNLLTPVTQLFSAFPTGRVGAHLVCDIFIEVGFRKGGQFVTKHFLQTWMFRASCWWFRNPKANHLGCRKPCK